MNIIVPILIGAAALLALGAGGGAQGSGGPTPQRVPTNAPPSPPPSPEGEDRNDDRGRAWGTFYANRNEQKHWELKVFSVPASAGNAAIGTGEVIADVYTTVVANADWQWSGQSCGGTRWRLRFSGGVLQDYSPIGPIGCQSVRPLYEVFARQVRWIQVGPNILLTVDTESGLNKLSPDKLLKNATSKPGRYGGTGKFYDASSSSPQWNNAYVASGYVTLDALWIFNPA